MSIHLTNSSSITQNLLCVPHTVQALETLRNYVILPFRVKDKEFLCGNAKVGEISLTVPAVS